MHTNEANRERMRYEISRLNLPTLYIRTKHAPQMSVLIKPSLKILADILDWFVNSKVKVRRRDL